MATVLEDFTTEEQHSIVRFCGQKDSMQGTFIKKYFLFTVGSVCRLKKHGRCSTDDEEVEMEIWKWLRQQSKDFSPTGSNSLVKQWDKCINVGGGYVEK
jgi:hypothetical protein